MAHTTLTRKETFAPLHEESEEYANQCWGIAHLTVVGENVKFTLAMRPVQKGESVGEVVQDLIDDAREHVTISMVYADSEFCFGFAVLLYDMWLLVDLLVQTSLDIDHRYKPRVTAKRFLNLVRKQLAGIG